MAEIADDAWRAAEAAMDAMLRRRGTALDVAADVKQHVAVLAVERHRARPFQTRNGFVKWAVWVAWNRATDEWRAERRRRLDPRPIPEVPDAEDVDERARHRVALAQVAVALRKLTPRERTAVVAPLRQDYDMSTAAERDRRYAARASLRRIVRDFPVVAPLIRLRWRPRRLVAAVAVAAPVAVVVLLGTAAPHLRDVPPASRFGSPLPASVELTAQDSRRVESHGLPELHAPPRPHSGGNASFHVPPRPDDTPRIDVVVPDTPAGVHIAAPPNDGNEPLLCVATFASPHTCFDLDVSVTDATP